MASIYNTDPNITYADFLTDGTADGTGITTSIKYITDGKGVASALGISTTTVYASNITFNGSTISSADTGSITISPNTTFSGNVTVNGTFTATISAALTSTHIFVGNGSNIATDVALSGDISLLNTGVSTVNKIKNVSVSSTNATAVSNLTGINSGDQTNISGNAATVTTNANLTGPITSSGNTTAVASQTGTGSTFVMNTSPTLVTPNLGTVSGGNLSAATGHLSTMSFQSGGSIAANTTQYIGLGYNGGSAGAVSFPVSQACVIQKLYIVALQAPVSAQTYTYTIYKNGVATALTCQLAGSNTSANDTTHSVSFAVGDVITLQVVTSSTAAAGWHSGSVQVAI